ncbi:MAG TPA: hypothetical protein PK874_10745 [Desulfobacteraceae bacterium]|nr:hypothetical protein [Desulfobacteraceae bacterium]HPJ68904.1 hypothetical protein [Desulfobacteraceae bacterium]HPQ27724.1 hypothetical protein [Desulfobacteraceae bacterium]
MRTRYWLIFLTVIFLFLFCLPFSAVAEQKPLKRSKLKVMVIIYSAEVSSTFLGVELEGNRNAENQIERCLLDKGFQPVDAGQVSRRNELEAFLRKDDPSAAGRIAGNVGADILVQGDVRRTFVDRRSILGRSTRFFSNEIRLKAFEADTGKVLYSGYSTRPPSGAEAFQQLEDATRELCEEMSQALLSQRDEGVSQAGIYELSITDVSFTGLSKFKKSLQGVPGLSDIQVKNFQSGHALIEVRYKGLLEELAEKISRIKSPDLQIVGMQSESLEIRFTE